MFAVSLGHMLLSSYY